MTKINEYSLATDDEDFARNRDASPINLSPIRSSKQINTTTKKKEYASMVESPPKQRFKQPNPSERPRVNGKH